MNMKTVLLFAAEGMMVFALGSLAGGEYVMRRVDAMDAVRIAHEAETEKQRAEISARNDAAIKGVLDQLFACNAKFAESTVIYERAPQLTLGFSGVRGLPVIPIGGQGDEAPHWLIPAKIKPMVLGDSRGAVYYYMSTDNRMDGPYLPDVVTAARP